MQRLTFEFLDGYTGLLADIYPLASGVVVVADLAVSQDVLLSAGVRQYYVDTSGLSGYYRLIVRADVAPVLQTVANITASSGVFATGFVVPAVADVRYGVDRGDGVFGILVSGNATRPVGEETGQLAPVLTIGQRVEVLSLTGRPTGRFGVLVAMPELDFYAVATDDNKGVFLPASRLRPVYSQAFA